MAKLNWKIWVLIFVVLASTLALVPLDFTKGVKIISVEKDSTAYEQGLRAGQIITAVEGKPVLSFEDYSAIITEKFPPEEPLEKPEINFIIKTNEGDFTFRTNQTLKITISGNTSENTSALKNISENNSNSGNSSEEDSEKDYMASNELIITDINEDSPEYESGLRTGQKILSINGRELNNLEDYNNLIKEIFPPEEKQKLTITTTENQFILFTNQPPEINIGDIENTRLKTGLDLSGGARALVTTEEEITAAQLNDLIAITSERLNVYGLKDIVIRPVTDLSGNNFMLIEIAGSTPKELEDLVSQQGKFEAKIGNETVFVGGNKDVTYVARTGEQSGIYSCSEYQGGELCQFRFAISLSEEAAKSHAEITNKLDLDVENSEYLSEKLELYLDGQLVDSLYISKDLKGRETTQISIQGSGTGATREQAYNDALASMKQLQTVLITGSMPFKLKIEKLDTISPLLGEKFINTILLAGLASILAVGLIILLRYRKVKLSLAVLLTSLSEVIIILGISALFRRNLDLPAIAGIIAAIGTGVDSQIIILDESTLEKVLSLKERVKRALFIILGTYITTLFALLPLLWAGAGLLKGFAITTIIGISAGVFITRPAFAEIVKKILKD